jgi:hypothetical protein
VEGTNLILIDQLLATVQGSILGPVLYALIVSLLFDIETLSAFVDDIYIAQ